MKDSHNTIGKYKTGEKIFAKANSEVPLTVRRYIDRIYYCKFQDDPQRSEMALFEREIVGN